MQSKPKKRKRDPHELNLRFKRRCAGGAWPKSAAVERWGRSHKAVYPWNSNRKLAVYRQLPTDIFHILMNYWPNPIFVYRAFFCVNKHYHALCRPYAFIVRCDVFCKRQPFRSYYFGAMVRQLRARSQHRQFLSCYLPAEREVPPHAAVSFVFSLVTPEGRSRLLVVVEEKRLSSLSCRWELAEVGGTELIFTCPPRGMTRLDLRCSWDS